MRIFKRTTFLLFRCTSIHVKLCALSTYIPLEIEFKSRVDIIDIYLSGLLARRQNAWSQDGGNMRVIANGVNR